jgi:hypothetical protein
MAQIKAIWNSSKGYSKPNEVVTIIQIRNDLAQIQSQPDEEEKNISPDGFWYWVPIKELNVIQ